MKSFADLKRSIRVGTRIICLSHWQDAKVYREPRPPMAGVIRTVQKAQGNGYFYHVPDNPKRMWADYPSKRADLSFGPDETFTITFGELGTATFQVLEEKGGA